MKTTLRHAVFGTLFILTLAAQAQLTQPNLPDHGFSFVYGVTNLQPEGFDWSAALSIQNVNFDFVPADSTAYADLFSNAEFSQQTPAQAGGINEAFYEYNADYFGFWGGIDGASGAQIVHPEVVEYLPYPMEVGDVHQDTLVFDFMVSGLAYVRDYSVDMEAVEVGLEGRRAFVNISTDRTDYPEGWMDFRAPPITDPVERAKCIAQYSFGGKIRVSKAHEAMYCG